jgi:hypothetical protein
MKYSILRRSNPDNKANRPSDPRIEYDEVKMPAKRIPRVLITHTSLQNRLLTHSKEAVLGSRNEELGDPVLTHLILIVGRNPNNTIPFARTHYTLYISTETY